MFHYTVASPYNFDTTLEKVEVALKEEEFGVLWNFDVNAKLEEKGFKIDHTYRILEVCNPKVASEVLSKNPLASYFLPCKVVVYVENDQVNIGMPKPTTLIEFLGSAELNEVGKNVEERLTNALNKAVQ